MAPEHDQSSMKPPGMQDRPRLSCDGTLICPGCGNDYLHHGKVEVFERATEDAPSSIVVVSGDGPHEGQNPSSRRNGLLIYFDCETCDAAPVLAVLQHKGQTVIEWQLP